MIVCFRQMAQSVESALRVARILLEIKAEREIKKTQAKTARTVIDMELLPFCSEII